MLLLVIFLSDKPKGLFRNGGFSFGKRQISEANISRSKSDFDLRLSPMENMNLPLSAYTHFRGVTDHAYFALVGVSG
jgi:hypothetical protein